MNMAPTTTDGIIRCAYAAYCVHSSVFSLCVYIAYMKRVTVQSINIDNGLMQIDCCRGVRIIRLRRTEVDGITIAVDVFDVYTFLNISFVAHDFEVRYVYTVVQRLFREGRRRHIIRL